MQSIDIKFMTYKDNDKEPFLYKAVSNPEEKEKNYKDKLNKTCT